MPRLIRILVYEAIDTELQDVLLMRAVKGSRMFGNRVLIREAIIGDFLEVFDAGSVEQAFLEGLDQGAKNERENKNA